MTEKVERDQSKSGREALRTQTEGWLHRGSLDMNTDRDVVKAHLCAYVLTVTVHLIVVSHVYDPVGRNVIQE